MSFSSDVKKELTGNAPAKKCCTLAQITGFLRFAGSIVLSSGIGIKVVTESPAAARFFAILIKDYFGIRTSLSIEESAMTRGHEYMLRITHDDNAEAILRETGILAVKEGSNVITDGIAGSVIKKKCCKKAALCGIFLASGSVTSPSGRGYHLEIGCTTPAMAEDVRRLLDFFDIEAKILTRKNKYAVYLKDREKISDFLGLIGASSAMFEYQNAIILKEKKNQTNRIVNCETANLEKTVNAAQKQIADIKKIGKTIGIDNLPAKLRDTAYLRLANPDVSLAELALMCDPPLKKSGLNHRFEKLAEIASSC